MGNDRVVTFPAELNLSQDGGNSPPLLSPTESVHNGPSYGHDKSGVSTVTFAEEGSRDDGGIDFDTGTATGARLPGRIQRSSEDRKVSAIIL